MKTKARLEGFKYIYATDQPDTAVVRFTAEGITGLLGLSRLEWVIRRGDPASIARCCTELILNAPIYATKNGSVEAAQREVDRWAYPVLDRAMRAWQ
jgi:hypothetical protein